MSGLWVDQVFSEGTTGQEKQEGITFQKYLKRNIMWANIFERNKEKQCFHLTYPWVWEVFGWSTLRRLVDKGKVGLNFGLYLDSGLIVNSTVKGNAGGRRKWLRVENEEGTSIFKTLCRKSPRLRRFGLRHRKLMNVMPQRRSHFKNDEIIYSVEYQRQVKTMYSPQIKG